LAQLPISLIVPALYLAGFNGLGVLRASFWSHYLILLFTYLNFAGLGKNFRLFMLLNEIFFLSFFRQLPNSFSFSRLPCFDDYPRRRAAARGHFHHSLPDDVFRLESNTQPAQEQ
jgi:hypothetical protein